MPILEHRNKYKQPGKIIIRDCVFARQTAMMQTHSYIQKVLCTRLYAACLQVAVWGGKWVGCGPRAYDENTNVDAVHFRRKTTLL